MPVRMQNLNAAELNLRVRFYFQFFPSFIHDRVKLY